MFKVCILLSMILVMLNELVSASSINNLQDIRRQAQERQERLEQDSGVRITEDYGD